MSDMQSHRITRFQLLTTTVDPVEFPALRKRVTLGSVAAINAGEDKNGSVCDK